MQDLALVVALTALSIGFALYGRSVSRKHNRRQLPAWRAAEEAELAAILLPAGNSRYALSGQAAETVLKKEEYWSVESGAITRLSITRYLRNPSGEYFYWKWSTDDGLFIKHIAHASAKAILKGKYVAPTAA